MDRVDRGVLLDVLSRGHAASGHLTGAANLPREFGKVLPDEDDGTVT